MRMNKLLTALVILGISQIAPVRGDENDASGVTTVTPAQTLPQNAPPPEKSWRFGLAVGYGERTNPLIQSDNIPVFVDVDLAWFGKRWFFDNGDVGFELFDSQRSTTNLVARVNSDRTFFSKTNTRGVTFAYTSGGVPAPVSDPLTGQPLVDPVELTVPKRDYAIELGLETLLDGEWGQATFHAFRDVSGTHDGFEVSADYSYRFTRGRLSFAPSAGVSYKSARLSDYYWGVHKEESSFLLPQYAVKGGLGWEAGLRANYYVTKKTRLAVSANYERLQHDIAQSPLVEQDYVFGYFAGVSWQF
jgi:outer membrane protein